MQPYDHPIPFATSSLTDVINGGFVPAQVKEIVHDIKHKGLHRYLFVGKSVVDSD
jgi:hypothetical protein